MTKLTPDAKTILYSTYLGGDSSDEARKIITDAAGNAYVLGYSRSSDFPTINALQTNLGRDGFCYSGTTQRECHDTFLTKLNSNGALVWSTYLGGGWEEFGYGLARDTQGALYMVGVTESPLYPITVGAVQSTYGGNEEGFITKITESDGAVTPTPVTPAPATPTPATPTPVNPTPGTPKAPDAQQVYLPLVQK